jgi:hypothetical protein
VTAYKNDVSAAARALLTMPTDSGAPTEVLEDTKNSTSLA